MPDALRRRLLAEIPEDIRAIAVTAEEDIRRHPDQQPPVSEIRIVRQILESANIGEVPSSASWIGRLPESFCHTGNCRSNSMREEPISTVAPSPSPRSMRRRWVAHSASLLAMLGSTPKLRQCHSHAPSISAVITKAASKIAPQRRSGMSRSGTG
ncbi:MAG TPA: hypothetical protein VJ862_02980 [Rhodanobacteraceae bacterium]|nr:hypothetical protein [Rhodanobacteraceae bacterium]